MILSLSLEAGEALCAIRSGHGIGSRSMGPFYHGPLSASRDQSTIEKCLHGEIISQVEGQVWKAGKA